MGDTRNKPGQRGTEQGDRGGQTQREGQRPETEVNPERQATPNPRREQEEQTRRQTEDQPNRQTGGGQNTGQ